MLPVGATHVYVMTSPVAEALLNTSVVAVDVHPTKNGVPDVGEHWQNGALVYVAAKVSVHDVARVFSVIVPATSVELVATAGVPVPLHERLETVSAVPVVST